MLQLAGILANELSIRTGIAVGFEPDGRIAVLTEGMDEPVLALFLRTSAGPLPEVREGDSVLVAVDGEGAQGFVLGLVETYQPSEPPPGTVEIAQFERADGVHVKGRSIYIEAGEELELRCGDGTIRIDKQGKVVVRGNEVVSRARRMNKIKGASVAIN